MDHILSRTRRTLSTLSAIAFLSFSTAYAQPNGCGAHAGTIDIDFGPVCLIGGEATFTATPGGDAQVPNGFTTAYVLTRTNGLIIEQVNTDPTFTVNSVDVWRVHTLVYNPATLDLGSVEFGSTNAYELQEWLVQGGGEICASLAISGAALKTADCPEPCTAVAAGLEIDAGPVCLVDGEAVLTATVVGTNTVPAGYEVAYILTRTNGLIIEQVGSTPSFTVNTEDVFRLHTLVHDPATLDLASVEPGITTAYDVQALLIQGGGTICASLDISGAPTKTHFCEPVECTANAGGISANQGDLCLTDGQAQLAATPDGNANVPAGYATAYLLTEDAGNTILGTSTTPEFSVTTAGAFTIHTLVHDPATLDLSDLVLGVTTVADVIAVIQQSQGTICAALHEEGAHFQVADCEPACEAFAGTLGTDSSEVCLHDGLAELHAHANGDAVVPDGYVVAYILTQGPELLIRNVEPISTFEWPLTGNYTIHTLVYDPNTFDLSFIQLDLTTAYEVNDLLVQGGGSICASLDLLGAQFTIQNCAPACGTGQNIKLLVCYTDPAFSLFNSIPGGPCPGGYWTTPNGNAFSGIFNPAQDIPGVYFYATTGPNGEVDTVMVVVNLMECPGEQQQGIEFGKQPQLHGNATNISDAGAFSGLQLWPNPATDAVRVQLPFQASERTRVDLFDATGRHTAATVTTHGQGLLMDVSTLVPGTWTIRVTDVDQVYMGRFVRAGE